MEGAQVLLIESQDSIALPLQQAFTREGYVVRRADCGAQALHQLETSAPDLALLDLDLPDVDALELCRRVRADGHNLPIIILSARGDELDRVVGLDSGADDYVSKPFGLAELLARIRALLRRAALDAAPVRQPDGSPCIEVGELRIDSASRRCWSGTDELALTSKEFGLLQMLMRRVHAVVSREEFMTEVWDEHWFGSTKTLDVTLGRLRQKLAVRTVPVQIVAVRGIGYRLERTDG